MKKSEGTRVFILGAGASVWAGFPLGRGLWEFLADHTSTVPQGMEFIKAHIASTPKAQRDALVVDLELLLTRYQSGDLPDLAGPAALKIAAESGPGDLIAWSRHGGVNVDWQHKAMVTRMANGVLGWNPSAMATLLRSISRAFLCHHACIRYGRDCHAHADYSPSNFENRVCSCFPDSSFRRRHWRLIAAVKRAFRPGDTIVTFNWDCLLESLLMEAGNWGPLQGYGFTAQFDRNLPTFARRSMPKLSPHSRIQVLKPHGSINWVATAERDQVALEFLDKIFGLPTPRSYWPDGDEDLPDAPFINDILLAPTYDKAYNDHPVLQRVWDRTFEAISRASEISVLGYSLPPSDLSSREMLTQALCQNKNCSLINIATTGDFQKHNWYEFAIRNGKTPKPFRGTFEQWAHAASR